MGLQKVSSKVGKKTSKLESLKKFVFGECEDGKALSELEGSVELNHFDEDEVSAPVQSGPAHKKSSSGKTQAPGTSKPMVKEKSTVSPSSNKGGAKSEMKQQSKTKAGSAGKKGGSLTSGRGHLESSVDTVCREVACEGLATSGGYCRLHYIKNWKKIKRKEMILREKKLNQYIEELVAKYPDKYIEAIRQDLANDKDFAKVIYDLDLDEGVDDFDVEGSDSVDSLIDTIKRDFDDEGESF